ncbi:MAG: iron-containing alcohol dehydrogenase [Christensenellales bacterium]|jgi:alcohol dehydrogenase
MTWKIHDLHDALFGVDSRKQAGEILKKLGGTKALLVCGPNINSLGYPEELIEILKDSGIETVLYVKEEGEPTGDMVNKGVEIARTKNIDAIVGLGGGSTMDTAKMIGKVLANDAKRAEDLLGGYTALNVGTKVFSPVLLLSTTAGTGSEVSWGLMCENTDTLKKTFSVHPATYAILDPLYYTTQPKEIIATCGMDSLAHSLESLCNSVAMPHPLADMYCREGIIASCKALLDNYNNPTDIEACSQMAYAAMIGGAAITLRKTNLGHAVSNQLVDYYHFSHGVAVSVGLMAQLMYNIEKDTVSSSLIAPCMNIEFPKDTDLKIVGQKIYDKVFNMQKIMGIKNMKELGVPEDFCDTIAENVSKDKKWAIVPNPPDFDYLRVVLHKIWNA